MAAVRHTRSEALGRGLARKRTTSSSTAISADGRLVAKVDANHLIELRPTRDGRQLATLRGSTGYVSQIAFSPSGELVAAASFDRNVRVWRVWDGRRSVRTPSGHTARVGDLAFSPDGELLASASQDRTARIWRVADWTSDTCPSPAERADHLGGLQQRRRHARHGRRWRHGAGVVDGRLSSVPCSAPHALAQSRPSCVASYGRSVVTLILMTPLESGGATVDRRSRRCRRRRASRSARAATSCSWRAEATSTDRQASDGREIGLLRGHTDIVNDARFSPKGDLIVTSSDDGTGSCLADRHANGTVAALAASGFTDGAPTSLREAMLAADGRLVTVSDGGARLYACEPCLAAKRLTALAKERLAAR